MSANHITTITRREVTETLRDWRIILPISLLVFIVPMLMTIALVYTLNFLDDAQLVGRLVPVTVLLVGFIPASFSIITALESIVGERERNTLESLLAMPLSDRHLYISKLIASLFTPLMASYSAIVIITFLLYSFAPTFYFAGLSPLWLLLLFILVGLLAVVMVAAAVVVSSHISSIRAANLMSSLILVPAVVFVQFVAWLIISDRWLLIWFLLPPLALLVVALIRLGLQTFNREEILAREGQPLHLPGWLAALRPQPTAAPRARPRFQARRLPPVLTVLRRELRETLTDWRILLPIAVLTLVVPLVLTALAGTAVAFVDSEQIIGTIVPFVLLLVGFIPASFSLITALDSFVGERERSTLESLLAMPIRDQTLYVSKFLASFITPLGTSYAAMLTFALLLSIVHPSLFAIAMTPIRLLQMLAFIGVATLVMVAGAVIISSHTSSIRAANLMASFVLIPVTVILQLQSPLVIAGRWDLVGLTILAMLVAALAFIRTGIQAFNREELLSREHEQLNLRTVRETFTRFFHEYQPAGVAPDAYRGLSFSPRRFYRHEFPALLRELRPALGVALIATFGGILLGGAFGRLYPTLALDMLSEQLGTTPEPGAGMALGVMVNNLRVSILSNLFSLVSFGLFAFLVPAVAFLQISFIFSSLHNLNGGLALGQDSPMQFLLAYVLPHGIIELPTFLLSTALGVRLGVAVLSPPGRFSVAQNVLWALAVFAKTWLLVLLPLIVISACVEGFITPYVVRALYGS